MQDPIVINCLKGRSAHRTVLLGFAPADVLYRHSFPDVLNEDSGLGYQRPFNERHSQDFRKYIKEPGSSTIPLTLNLRPDAGDSWCVKELPDGQARLEINKDACKIMAQVDCQHRLGHLGDLPIQLPFMCFIGLTEREEMEVFSIINGKAKGLSTSLLDYHEAQLAEELAAERPELFVALQLNSLEGSPWHRRLNLGGKNTSGLKRITSLRMMQQAILSFLRAIKLPDETPAEEALSLILDFWSAVTIVLPEQWADPRRHMLTKGIGVYSLTRIAADIVIECSAANRPCDRRAFTTALADFAGLIDWSTSGPLRGFGGQSGVKQAVEHIRNVRKRARYKVVHA